jgi:hypothetical protein
MIPLFRKFPAGMGTLCLFMSIVFLYLALEQYTVSRDLPKQPEKPTLAEIQHRMTANPVDIWAEVMEGCVDCGSIETWKATTNFFIVDKYSTLLITDYEGKIVLRGTVDDWPDCDAIVSRLPMTGIVSQDKPSIATRFGKRI